MNKFLNRTVWLVVIIPVIYLALVWNSLPDKIAMHFDLQGNPDKYDSKNQFVWFSMMIIAVSIGVYLLLINVWRIDPKKYAAENKGRLQKIAFALVVFLAVIHCIVIYISTQGNVKLNLRFFFALIGIFWAVIANYMNNLKPNYFAGFRLPWTLENEENWRRTHHLASKLWFAGGLLIAAICIFTSTTVSIVAIFCILLIITVIPIVYSYRLYKRQKSLKPVD
jgi:immunity protein, SdpI family